MPRILTLYIFLLLGTPLFAQKLSGNWVGYFTNKSGNEEKTYPYEINISDGNNQIINATTITHFSNQFSATATARGVYTQSAGLLNLQETKFEQLRIDGSLQGCLMNNYLTYQNSNGKETLQGTYFAKNAVNGSDCGMGSVYLSRNEIKLVRNASRKNDKSPIVQKSNSSNKITNNTVVKSKIYIKTDSSVINTIPEKSNVNSKLNETTNKDQESNNNLKTSSSDNITNTSNFNKLLSKTNVGNNASVSQNNSVETPEKHQHILMPWVIISRENILIKKIITHSKTVNFDLFDNGTIDNDTITIYDNKSLMIDKNRLSYKATHFEINFSESLKEHEIILVANNLGAVPPNTALLIYKDAKQTEELFINTNFTQNAKLIIQYQPPAK